MSVIYDTLVQFGLSPSASDIVPDGTIHRCSSSASKKKNKNGWFAIREHNGDQYCIYGCWVRGEKGKVSTKEGMVNGSCGKEAYKIWAELAQIAQYEQEERQENAATEAANIWDESETPDKSHNYLEKKRIAGHGVRQKGNDIICPVIGPCGKLTSIQTIKPDGSKKFMSGGAVKGGAMCIGIPGNVILICEGYATGCSLYQATNNFTIVAYNAGNIKPVAESAVEKYPNAEIIICADNDHAKDKNVGLETGKKVASELGLICLWPTGIKGSDFNDMAVEIGEQAISDLIIKRKVLEIYSQKDEHCEYPFLNLKMPAVMQAISDHYHATAIKPQPLFGVATALIIGSVVLGRRYSSDFDNYSSLYFVLAAQSGTGKDHPKNLISNILEEMNLGWMRRSGGYTSASSVIRSLERQPLQITFFEEIGQRLQEASKNNKSLAASVFRQLLDVWSSCHSVCVGDEYVDGTTPKVARPALTTVGITTPKQFFDATTESLIEQGFMNRLLPFFSDEEMKATKLNKSPKLETPKIIKDWIKHYWPLLSGDLGSIVPPDDDALKNPDLGKINDMTFSDNAIDLLNAIEEDIVNDAKKLAKLGIMDMLSRNREITMRVSMTIAAFDYSSIVEDHHVEFAYTMVRDLYRVYIDRIKRKVSGSDFEEMKLTALNALRQRGEKGVRPADMPKTPPWSKWEKRQRVDILSELQEAGLADTTKVRTGKRGPGQLVWVALK